MYSKRGISVLHLMRKVAEKAKTLIMRVGDLNLEIPVNKPSV